MRFLPAGIRDLLVSRFYLNLGRRLVEVFVPLLLWSRGLPLWQVTAYYALSLLAGALLCRPAAKLASRHSLRQVYLVGYAATVAYQLLLGIFVSVNTGWAVLTALVVANATTNIYLIIAVAMHTSDAMEVSREGRDVAFVQMTVQLASLLGPLLGGLIAAWFGAVWLLAGAIAMVVLGMVQLRGVDQDDGTEIVPFTRISYRPLPPWRDLVAGASLQVQAGIGTIAWPIYLTVETPGFRSIGAIVTVGSVMSFAVVGFAARNVDNGRRRHALHTTVALLSLIYLADAGLAMIAPKNVVSITVSTAVFGVVFTYFCVPWFASYYGRARKDGVNYVMAMETSGALGGLLLWSVFAAFLAAGFSVVLVFQFVFVIGAIATWGCRLIERT